MGGRADGVLTPNTVLVLLLSVGTVLEAAISKYQGKQTGENSLFRKLYDALDEGDIILVDRYFSGWSDIALPLQRGVDIVVRKHQHRATDFRMGKRLGKDDHLVFWTRPQRPKWMSVEQYATLPDELTLREVRIRVAQKGFRTESLVVVTTLLDAEEYPPEEIALLTAVATHVVGNRPDRFEPRLRKRRPKPYKHLREPRRNYKLKL
jgi:hypothetical protein